MSPTYEYPPAFDREFRELSGSAQDQFKAAVSKFVAGLGEGGSAASLDPGLRVKRVTGHPGVWEISFAADGRATFSYGTEINDRQAHVVWRRIGDHSIFDRP